jgi:hypothetical protein
MQMLIGATWQPPAPVNVPGAPESTNGSTPTWNFPAAPPDGPAAT